VESDGGGNGKFATTFMRDCYVQLLNRIQNFDLILKFVRDNTMYVMDLQTTKIMVMLRIMNVSKASLLEKINTILDEEMIVGYTTDGSPLTTQQYNERLLVAEKQIESGDYSTQEDLEKEIENW
jgi:hypothetical protein